MYILELQDIDGNMIDQKPIGNWRDHAVEKFKSIRFKMSFINTTGKLVLIDDINGDVIAEHKQIGNENG